MIEKTFDGRKNVELAGVNRICGPIALLTLCWLFMACGQSAPQTILNVSTATATPSPNLQLSNDEMVRLIDSCWCREDDDPDLTHLLAIPRVQMIEAVQQAVSSIEGSPMHGVSQMRYVKYSYILVRLGVDAESNKERIVKAVLRTSDAHVRGDGIGYLGVLISKGSKELLHPVFSLASKSDAAASMEIVEILRKELITSTDEFLGQLANEPKDIRKAVLKLISAIEYPQLKQIQDRVRNAGKINFKLKEISILVIKALRYDRLNPG